MATDFDKKLVNGETLGKVAKGVLDRAKAADTALEGKLQGKIDTVSGSVTTLGGKVDTAVEALQNTDSQLQKAINDEATRADAEEKRIVGLVEAEAAKAREEEGKLEARITEIAGKIGEIDGSEVQNTLIDLSGRMTAAEGDIDDLEEHMTAAEGDIDALETRMTATEGVANKAAADLTTEIARAKEAEGVNAGAIQTEKERAIAEEGRLAGLITALQGTDSSQAALIEKAQGAAEKAQGEVDALETVVGKLDTRLTNAVSAEQSRAEGKEAELLAKINKEVGDRGTAITDVRTDMGTMKTELQAEIAQKIQEVNGAAGELAGRVSTNEGNIVKLMGGEDVDGSVAKALKDAKKYTDDREVVIKEYADDAVEAEATLRVAEEAAIREEMAEEATRVNNKIATDIAAESAKRVAEEAKIRQELANEKAALQAEIDTDVAAEAKLRGEADAAIRSEMATMKSGLEQGIEDAVAAEKERAMEEEGKIRDEFADADEVLTGLINGLDGRLDAIEGEKGLIAQAEAAAKAHADAEVKKLADNAVATNTAAIATLNGGEEVDGSVAKKIKDAIDKVNGAATLLEGRVADNTAAIATLNGGEEVEGSVAKALKDAKAHADKKVADLVGSAPEAMDTLQELAKAINDNKSIYDTYIGEHATAMANMKSELQAEIDSDVKVIADELAKQKDAKQEGTLAQQIAAEVTRATAKEGELSQAIATEKRRAEGVEATIRGEIADETARVNKKIADDIAAESAKRVAEEARIEGLVTAEAAKAREEEGKLADAIANEVQDRKDAIIGVQGQIAQEATDRGQAISNLRTDVANTFKGLELNIVDKADNKKYIQLNGEGFGENNPLAEVEVVVMTSDDVELLLGELDKVQE